MSEARDNDKSVSLTFMDEIMALETIRDRPLLIGRGPNEATVTGFCTLYARKLMGICLSHGKAFKVVWETPDAEVLEVQFEDRQYAVPNTASVSIAKMSEFISDVKKEYGWEMIQTVTAGHIVAIQFMPTAVTHMATCEHLLSLEGVLEIEFRPNGCYVTFLSNSNRAENPIRSAKRRNPEMFRTHSVISATMAKEVAAASARAGKSTTLSAPSRFFAKRPQQQRRPSPPPPLVTDAIPALVINE